MTTLLIYQLSATLVNCEVRYMVCTKGLINFMEPKIEFIQLILPTRTFYMWHILFIHEYINLFSLDSICIYCSLHACLESTCVFHWFAKGKTYKKEKGQGAKLQATQKITSRSPRRFWRSVPVGVWSARDHFVPLTMRAMRFLSCLVRGIGEQKVGRTLLFLLKTTFT